jgi:PST family polysaccharide transporter
VEEFGKFTFALALAAGLSLISDFGLSEITKRSVAREPGSAEIYFGNVLSWKILLSLAAILLSVGTILVLKRETDIRLAVLILAVAAMLKSLKYVPLIFFQALERFDLFALFQITHNLGLLVFGAMALNSGAGLIGFVLVFAAYRLVDCLVTYAVAGTKVLRIMPKFDTGFIRRLQVEALPVGASSFLIGLYWFVGTILLSMMRTDIEVGWYNAALKIFEGLSIFPLMLRQAVSPQMARLFKSDPAEHMVLTRRVLKITVMAAGLIAVCGVVLSEELIHLLFGGEFVGAVLPLQVLFAGYVFLFLNIMVKMIFISIDRQNVLAVLGLFGLTALIGLNVLLIPAYGHVGAALALTLGETTMLAAGYVYLRKTNLNASLLTMSAKPALAGGLLAAFLLGFGVKVQVVHLLFIVPVYATLLLLFRAFDDEELDTIRRVLLLDRSELK